MTDVHLSPISASNLQECIRLDVEESQRQFVAPNAKSLAEASVDPNLYPFAIYDGSAIGWTKPQTPMVGFTMYEIVAGVGFIMRLMIDQEYQRQGYGRAAVQEVIRRLQLYPEVRLIATSHRRENSAAAKLFRGLGFVDWDIEWAGENSQEVYLRLGVAGD